MALAWSCLDWTDDYFLTVNSGIEPDSTDSILVLSVGVNKIYAHDYDRMYAELLVFRSPQEEIDKQKVENEAGYDKGDPSFFGSSDVVLMQWFSSFVKGFANEIAKLLAELTCVHHVQDDAPKDGAEEWLDQTIEQNRKVAALSTHVDQGRKG